jgi:hypothetical protein
LGQSEPLAKCAHDIELWIHHQRSGLVDETPRARLFLQDGRQAIAESTSASELRIDRKSARLVDVTPFAVLRISDANGG